MVDCRRFLLMSLALAGAPQTYARDDDWSASIRMGAVHMQDSITGFPSQDRPPYRFEYDTGSSWSLGLGHAIGPRLKAELEYTGRANDLAGSSPAGSTADGRLDVDTLMINLYVDLRQDGDWRPYLGLGAGYAWVALDDYRVDGVELIDDREHAVTLQWTAGLRYIVDESWQASLDYRGMWTTDPLLTNAAGDIMETSVLSHALVVGITRRF